MHTIADLVIHLLQQAGITTFFGLPGGENVPLLEAIRRQGMPFVLTRHEGSAALMASATARLTRRPSACLVTLGPGATNATSGVAHAYLDRAPMLIITPQMPVSLHPYHTHQCIDIQTMFEPITKGSFIITADNAQETIIEAARLATTGQQGPVHLQISAPVAAQPAPTSIDSPPQITPLQAKVDESRLQQIGHHLAQARQPILIAGLGLEPEAPYATLQHLVETWSMPLVMTAKAKGCLADDHPLCGGAIGLTRTDPTYELLDEADLILAVGFDPVELVRPWSQKAPLIWLANWPNEDPHLQAVAEYVGPLQPALSFLATAGEGHEPGGWDQARLATFRQEQQRPFPPAPPQRIAPQAALATLRATFPRETITITDVGSHKILAGLSWPMYEPNSYFVSNGLSCMGYGLATAIAAGRLDTGKPILCITGDGGLLMVLGELGLLPELTGPIMIAVFHDGALDLIRRRQRKADKVPFGTEFTTPNFKQIARAFGLDFYRVTDESSCQMAACQVLNNGRPALVELLIGPYQ